MIQLRASFLALSAFALLPAVALLPGCSGSSNNSTPVSALTPTPTPTAGPFQAAPIDFGNGQHGTLSLRAQGITAIGQLEVLAPVAPVGAALSAQAVLPTITPGTYKAAGTIKQPRAFLVTGAFPAPVGAFVVKGNLPSPAGDGDYTLTVDHQTFTGVYPIQPTPTPTTAPTATPTTDPTATPTTVPTATATAVPQ